MATALPVKFVSALASFINLSTPNNNASRLTGITFTAESLDASTIKQLPVTPAAFLDVDIIIPITVKIYAAVNSSLKTYNRKRAAVKS